MGTRACQELWGMRREACLQLNTNMAIPQADILEHERTHLPWLPHACRPSQTSYQKLLTEVRGGNTESEPVLTTAECRIMVYKLLQCDPNKVWVKNHLHTFSNRSDRRTSSTGGIEESDTASTGYLPQPVAGKRSTCRNQRGKRSGKGTVGTEERNEVSRAEPL